MKATFIIVLVFLSLANCYYLAPHANRPVKVVPLRNLNDLLYRLNGLALRRCANLFDESCANGGMSGAGADDDWLNGNTNPGKKRCANLFDESCSNGDINGAGSDDDWLNGDTNPGRR